MNLDSFKDPSQIPNSIKFGTMIALFAATLAVGYFFDTSDQITQLETLQTAETPWDENPATNCIPRKCRLTNRCS